MVRRHIERMIVQRAENFPVGEIMSPHQLGERWVWEIATDPKVLDMVERQIGPNIVLWHTDLLIKEPRTGRSIPWHQDQPYWNVSPPVSSLWIPFDDVNEENGTMGVLPRWHTKGALPRLFAENDFFDQSIDPASLPQNVDERAVVYRLQAGQAATHDPMIPHYSLPNGSNRWRRLMTLRYMQADGKDMGERHYTSYLDRTTFDREYYLVRGIDVHGRGLRNSPFE